MSEKKIQCLFDFINFYSKKSHLLFPGTLAFPQFFAISIRAVSYNFIDSKNFEQLCLSYCQILQTIVNRVYNNDFKRYKILIDCNQLKDAVTTRKNIDNDSFILLESYLKDNDSVNNYRTALLNETLSYYNFENINEFINHLCKRKCCTSEAKNTITPFPPSSKHYLIYPIQSNSSFISQNMFYTNGWGPFYWNIFHSVGEGGNNNNRDNELIKFIYVFSITVPCNKCRDNYINKIKSFENYNDINIKDLYQKIHDEVNYEKIRYVPNL